MIEADSLIFDSFKNLLTMYNFNAGSFIFLFFFGKNCYQDAN